MSSLTQRYSEIANLNPDRSTINCFVVAVAGQGYEQKEIRDSFKKLVDPREYQASDAKGLYYPLIDSVSPKNRQVRFAGMKMPKKIKMAKVAKKVTTDVIPDEQIKVEKITNEVAPGVIPDEHALN
jgi:hypothetical protein